ncbi:MAG: hypothetical protein QUU85_08815 [Candidatus Eisenbacteria bacterium]|nr:hypothetical protein [Candidatus Eisenbacteria bacterium]
MTAIVNPGYYPEILRLAGSRLGLATPPPQPPDDPYPLRTENVWIYYLVSIVHSLGLPIVALSAGGAVLAIRRRTMIDVSLLAFAVALYLFVCLPWSEDLIYPRYTLPIQLVLVLFAGWFVSWLLQWSFLVRRQKLAAPAAAVLLGLVALPPAIASLRYDAGASRPDSRTIARQWIVEHLPPESRILIEGRGYQTSTGTVPLVNRPENIEALVARFRSADARWSGKAAGGGEDSGSAGYGAGPGSGSDSYAPLKDRFHRAAVDAAASTRSFDLILFGTETLSYRRLSEYIEDGADYVVIEKDRMEKMREPGNAARFPEAARFYEDVASNGDLELMREFVPSAGGLGPVLRLYQVLRGDPDGAGSPGRR